MAGNSKVEHYPSQLDQLTAWSTSVPIADQYPFQADSPTVGEGSMLKKRIVTIVKRTISMGMPVAICVSLVLFPMRAILRQAMLGLIFLWLEIMLVWGRSLHS